MKSKQLFKKAVPKQLFKKSRAKTAFQKSPRAQIIVKKK